MYFALSQNEKVENEKNMKVPCNKQLQSTMNSCLNVRTTPSF